MSEKVFGPISTDPNITAQVDAIVVPVFQALDAKVQAKLDAKVQAKLDDMRAKLPSEWQPIVTQYGMVFARWSAVKVWEWIDMATKGDQFAAYKQVLQGMDNQALFQEMVALDAKWYDLNKSNAATLAWQRDAISMLLKVFVGMAAVAVGL